ncbi:MAG: hypothetical protein OEZ59_04235 [Deltaproteobacteria bacterium]|nr:hypothetical protein [Deltaproteobacteria bacterium]
MTKEHPEKILEKAADFHREHKRIVEDFQRSLNNSRYFLELARISNEMEPEETVSMLEQIKNIDLLGHLEQQRNEFLNVSGFFTSSDSQVQDEELVAGMTALEELYRELIVEAERQVDDLNELIAAKN